MLKLTDIKPGNQLSVSTNNPNQTYKDRLFNVTSVDYEMGFIRGIWQDNQKDEFIFWSVTYKIVKVENNHATQ